MLCATSGLQNFIPKGPEVKMRTVSLLLKVLNFAKQNLEGPKYLRRSSGS